QKVQLAETQVRLAEGNLKQAEAARDAAQLAVTRQRDLVNKEIGQQKAMDVLEAQLKAAEAAVTMAQVKIDEAKEGLGQAKYGLDLTTVRVPMGKDHTTHPPARKRQYTVIDRKVVLGQMIAPPISGQLFTLATDLGQMQIHAQVGENDISKVRSGLGA